MPGRRTTRSRPRTIRGPRRDRLVEEPRVKLEFAPTHDPGALQRFAEIAMRLLEARRQRH